MKRIIILITTLVLLFVILGISRAYSETNTGPEPVMQPVQLVPNGASNARPTPTRPGSGCPGGTCSGPQQMPPQGYMGPPPGYNGPQGPPPVNNAGPPPMGPPMPPPQDMNGPNNILIILDASYSMEDDIMGERKIDIAKRVVYNTVKNIPPNTKVGLRVYGHKIGIMGFYPCRKTELLVPIDFNTGDAIIQKLRNINPTGQTPITYSIRTAVENDFIGLNGPKRIILVSDGMETCDGDPCEFAVEMVRRGIDFKVDVVGFALKEPAAINQLKCVALSTGGNFYTADTEAALARSMQNSFHVKKDVQGRILFNK